MAFWAILGSGIWEGFKEIGRAYIREWSIWWVLAPIIILWIMLEVYFGEFKKEKLGWNTSLGNGITLMWVNINAMRYIFSTSNIDMKWLRFIVVILILAYSIFIIYISFTHKFSAKVTYILASSSPIYYLSMITVLWSYGQLRMTWWVLLDLFLFFGIILLIFWIVRKLIPESEKDVGTEEEKEMGGEFGGPGETAPGTGGLGGLAGGTGELGGEDFKL